METERRVGDGTGQEKGGLQRVISSTIKEDEVRGKKRCHNKESLQQEYQAVQGPGPECGLRLRPFAKYLPCIPFLHRTGPLHRLSRLYVEVKFLIF